MTEDAKNTPTLLARINDQFESLLLLIQAVALIIITVTTAIAIVDEGINMYESRKVGLANLLLLFLFIEILSMVRQYSLGQHELKLKTPLVITIVAVARYLIINMEHLTSKYILITSIAILILTFALYVARHIKDLYSDEREDKFKHKILKDAAEKLLHAGKCGKEDPDAKAKAGS
jgi:protein PsiE